MTAVTNEANCDLAPISPLMRDLEYIVRRDESTNYGDEPDNGAESGKGSGNK